MVYDCDYAIKKWRKSRKIDLSCIGPHDLLSENEFAVLTVRIVLFVRIEFLPLQLCFQE